MCAKSAFSLFFLFFFGPMEGAVAPHPLATLLNKPSSNLSVAVYCPHRAYTQSSSQGSAASRARRKMGRPFYGETPIFGKIHTNFRPFSGNFVLRSTLALNQPLPLNVNQRSKELRWLVRSRDVFTKRVLFEKHISGIQWRS